MGKIKMDNNKYKEKNQNKDNYYKYIYHMIIIIKKQ